MTMRALGVSSFGSSSKLNILSLSIPEITHPDDIIVAVKAFSLNYVDSMRSRGYSRLVETIKLPYIIGHDFAGTISAVGLSVTEFEPGDAVYGFSMEAGAAAEFMKITAGCIHTISKIPGSLTFEEASSLPTPAHTGIQALVRMDEEIPGGLKGKTVFVPAGLGGIGSLVLQLLKPVFGAEKVITTLSTAKIPLLPELLGKGLVDQIVDYTKEDVIATIGLESVDCMLDTIWMSMTYLPLLKKGGLVLSIMGKSGDTAAKDLPDIPWALRKVMNLVDLMMKWRARRWGVRYEHAHTQFERRDSEMIEKLVVEGKLKAVVGQSAAMDDLEAVRKMFDMVGGLKGATGKLVVKVC